MRVALIIPSCPKDYEDKSQSMIEETVRWVSARFRCGENMTIVTPGQYVDYYKELFHGYKIEKYEQSNLLDRYDISVFMEGDKYNQLPDDMYAPYIKRICMLDKDGRICSCGLLAYVRGRINTDTHVFNKLGPKSPEGGFHYFPYGYLFRRTGLVRLNAFGCRINSDFRKLQYRDANHKVIAVFGGSGAFSVHCLDEEMFTFRLEGMLNHYCSKHRIPLKFTVLNFSIPGYVVMNELLAYMLFCHQIRPDYVIGHDGNNDLGYGLVSDPFLLREYNLTYPYNLERWPQILHGTQDVPTNQPSVPFEPLNCSQDNIDAYILRKMQFQEIVESQGSTFIWGFEPLLYSKKKPSPDEQMYLMWLEECGSPFPNLLHKHIPFLYDQCQKRVQMLEGVRLVDFHRYFEQFGEDMTLFNDFIHTTPLGDEKIAECYFSYFVKELDKAFSQFLQETRS